jgi:hypothetical protein
MRVKHDINLVLFAESTRMSWTDAIEWIEARLLLLEKIEPGTLIHNLSLNYEKHRLFTISLNATQQHYLMNINITENEVSELSIV